MLDIGIGLALIRRFAVRRTSDPITAERFLDARLVCA